MSPEIPKSYKVLTEIKAIPIIMELNISEQNMVRQVKDTKATDFLFEITQLPKQNLKMFCAPAQSRSPYMVKQPLENVMHNMLWSFQDNEAIKNPLRDLLAGH